MVLLFSAYLMMYVSQQCGFQDLDLPCHRKGNPHLGHQKKDRCSSVTDERKRHARVRKKRDNNADIQDHLQCNVDEYPRHQKRSEQIRRVLCDKEEPVQQISKKQI